MRDLLGETIALEDGRGSLIVEVLGIDKRMHAGMLGLDVYLVVEVSNMAIVTFTANKGLVRNRVHAPVTIALVPIESL